MYDFCIAGAGFYGASFAREATDRGRKCIVFEKSPHVAGAAYDEVVNGIICSMYGAHIFHTDSLKVWKFINRFGEWMQFSNRPKAIVGQDIYSFPINMMTLHQLWGIMSPKEAETQLNKVRIPAKNPRNFEEWALSMIGRELYEKFIYGYTKKQYFREPRTLPSSIIRRLPVRLTFDDRYFTTKWEVMPVDGYTRVVQRMLDGVEVHLETPMPEDWRKFAKHCIYSGRADEVMESRFGPLEYLSMEFRHYVIHGDTQGNAVLNWCDQNIPQIRSVEHKYFRENTTKHMQGIPNEYTVISYDIPMLIGPPYYPIRTEENVERYRQYMNACPKDITLGGRIGSYKYYDMDQAISAALAKAEDLCT